MSSTGPTIGALSAAAVLAAMAAAEVVGCSSRQPNKIRVTAHLQTHTHTYTHTCSTSPHQCLTCEMSAVTDISTGS
jgi:hypothetical protein